jgi:hypothetical protein
VSESFNTLSIQRFGSVLRVGLSEVPKLRSEYKPSISRRIRGSRSKSSWERAPRIFVWRNEKSSRSHEGKSRSGPLDSEGYVAEIHGETKS